MVVPKVVERYPAKVMVNDWVRNAEPMRWVEVSSDDERQSFSFRKLETILGPLQPKILNEELDHRAFLAP